MPIEQKEGFGDANPVIYRKQGGKRLPPPVALCMHLFVSFVTLIFSMPRPKKILADRCRRTRRDMDSDFEIEINRYRYIK